MRYAAFSPLLLLALLPSCEPRDATDRAARDTASPRETGATPAATPAPASEEAKIELATSAAPASISADAAVMDWPETEGGEMEQLRRGSGEWVCFPSTPGATGAGGKDPMCLDETFRQWAEAWKAKTQPSVKTVGLGYMLQGDAGVSGTDPYATAPTPDNEWVRSGPHIMVVVPDPSQLDALPDNPESGGPWVMWKGTPYAHVMVPVE